jgi:transglutaminase-like putative cysteine protease
MMLLKVKHSTKYSYSETQRMILQSHRLHPSRCETQTILSWDVFAEGALFGEYFEDGGGDRLRTMSLNSEIDELEISVVGEVETHDRGGVIKLHRDLMPKNVYLQSTLLTKADENLRQLAAESIQSTDGSALDNGHAMMNSISDRIDYISGSTNSSFTAAQALQQGKGVCQDQAHCLLSISRLNNIPARYITGYLYDAEKGDNHGESHAWVELYIDGLGWIGFDAANQCCPDERYIRIGSGLDGLDGALIRGVTRGAGQESMLTNVEVSQAQQYQQQ